WNAQRAGDWADLPEHAQKIGARLVVTPLLHPTDEYHRAGRRGLDAVAARLVTDPKRFASLRAGRWDIARRARDVLSNAEVVLLAHQNEAALVRTWCGADALRTAVVPPAVPRIEATPTKPPLQGDFVLSVGRIEPLKNPLAVLAAARRLRLPVVFVGSMVRGRHMLHGRRFRQNVKRQGARWLGPLPADKVRGLMRRARVHVLASWTEVLGRVTVEAALEGCATVSSRVGHAPALLGETEGAFWTAPGDERALTQALAAAWAHGRRPDGPLATRATELLWDAVAPALLAAYPGPAG
ncbi:MAG: glycosyltransferase family 4 protein, partial [Deltaproteobacteria bacterium]|nr:glycosyltransferase family 4 protein [Deltaproteobacteria bacterium]